MGNKGSKTRRDVSPNSALREERNSNIRRWIADAVVKRSTSKATVLPPSREDAEDTVDMILELINSPSGTSSSSKSRRLPPKEDMRALMEEICLANRILPKRFYLHNIKLDGMPITIGQQNVHDYGKKIVLLWEGTWGTVLVAVKRFEYEVDTDRPKDALIHQEFCRTVLRFSQLKHKNVQEFLGVADDFWTNSRNVCLVTPWMPRGNIVFYLRNLLDNPACSSVGESIRRWLEEVAVGLRYLHDESICHGSLHPGNILIDNEDHVRLADFGFKRIAQAMLPPGGYFPPYGGPLRYVGPEGHDSESCGVSPTLGPTFASDIFAYACTCYELYARKAPYEELNLFKTIRNYLAGKRPERPVGTDGSGSDYMPDLIWSIVTRCWAQKLAERPPIQVIVDELLSDTASVSPR